MKKNFKTLEVGKTYRNREGNLITIVHDNGVGFTFRFRGSDGCLYKKDGSYFIREDPKDLIELIEEPNQTNSSPDYELFEEIERLEGMNQFLTQTLKMEMLKTTQDYIMTASVIDSLEEENRLLKIDIESNSILSRYLYNQIKELNWFQKLIFGYGKYRNITTTYQIFRDNGFRASKPKQPNIGTTNQKVKYENGTSKGY